MKLVDLLELRVYTFSISLFNIRYFYSCKFECYNRSYFWSYIFKFTSINQKSLLIQLIQYNQLIPLLIQFILQSPLPITHQYIIITGLIAANPSLIAEIQDRVAITYRIRCNNYEWMWQHINKPINIRYNNRTCLFIVNCLYNGIYDVVKEPKNVIVKCMFNWICCY